MLDLPTIKTDFLFENSQDFNQTTHARPQHPIVFIHNISLYVSRLRACGPVIPGIPLLAGVDLARYASGRYGDQVCYGDGILFLFLGGLTH